MSKNVHIVEQILMLFFWALYKKITLNNCIILEYIKKEQFIEIVIFYSITFTVFFI